MTACPLHCRYRKKGIQMKARQWLLLGALTLSLTAFGQNYHVGTTYTPLTQGAGGCGWQTLYDPTLYKLPSGDLHLLTQGGNTMNSCTRIDSFFGTTRNQSGGAWSAMGTSSCPEFMGGYTRCGYSPTVHGPIASPSVVQVPGDSRYFMAFSGGNADYFDGKVYWAVSNDGISWSVYNVNPPPGETWTPVLFGKYAGDCVGDGQHPNGIGQVQLAYENGYFYVFMSYYHYNSGALSPVVFRFDYSSAHAYGFGPSVRQVFHNGTWENNSGQFVWSDDGYGSNGTLLANGDHVIGIYDSMNSYAFGSGDLKHDDNQGWWVRVQDWSGTVNWQESSSLASGVWSSPTPIGNLPSTLYAWGTGLWFGSLSGSANRMWIWMPVNNNSCSGGDGLSLLPGTLDYP